MLKASYLGLRAGDKTSSFDVPGLEQTATRDPRAGFLQPCGIQNELWPYFRVYLTLIHHGRRVLAAGTARYQVNRTIPRCDLSIVCGLALPEGSRVERKVLPRDVQAEGAPMNPAIRRLLLASLILVSVISGAAQSPPQEHEHAAPTVIDGAVHPELIPDSVAYRLYLISVSTAQNPSEAEQQRQRRQLVKTGLADTDQQLLVGVLSYFRAQYDALVTEYNDSAKAGNAPDVHSLLKGIDDLVQSTRDTISVRLSSRGAAKLHAFVVSEKKNMKVTED